MFINFDILNTPNILITGTLPKKIQLFLDACRMRSLKATNCLESFIAYT